MNKEIIKARNFAIEKHGEQKYGELPYIYHLDMVYEFSKKFNLEKDYQVAAYLHDVLEDTNTNKEELEIIFGKRIADMVFSVTGEGKNRKEKNASIIKKLKNYPDGINLKMIDRYANMLESTKNSKLFKMYQNELEIYLSVFEKGNIDLLNQMKSITLKKPSMKP